jgi:hypothetical protein
MRVDSNDRFHDWHEWQRATVEPARVLRCICRASRQRIGTNVTSRMTSAIRRFARRCVAPSPKGRELGVHFSINAL